jgi:branched-chain amino acid transport system permease protein
VLPQLIVLLKDLLPAAIGQAPGLQPTLFGCIMIAFVLFEPLGIYGRWLKIRAYFQLYPFYRRAMFKRQKVYLKAERLR